MSNVNAPATISNEKYNTSIFLLLKYEKMNNIKI